MKTLLPFASAALLAAVAAPLPAQGDVVPIPNEVVDAIGAVLPERTSAGAAFLSPDYSPNLIFTSPGQVQVIFVWENTRLVNSMGWFLWDVVDGVPEILESGMLFPEIDMSRRGPLVPGSAVTITNTNGSPRVFQAGDRVGFFLIADGFRTLNDVVTNWRVDLGIPASDSNTNGATSTYTTIPEVNPEAGVDDGSKAGHVAMIRMPGFPGFLNGAELLVMGFEDQDRTARSDDDFNDTVFLIDVQPFGAIDRSRIAWFDPNDIDGDGVAGVEDAFPTDPTRAWVRRIPQLGYSVIAFEDYYPVSTDTDFNDALLAMAFTQVVDSSDRIVDVLADFHLVARGASFDHEFGLHVPTLPDGATGLLQIERFMSGSPRPEPIEAQDLAAVVAGGRRIDRIFSSTVAALPRAVPDKPFANTWLGHPSVEAASARIWIQFDVPVQAKDLGTPPYDPFLFVSNPDGTRADVHLPGFSSFPDRSPGLPQESGPMSFLDANGSPWALLVPTTWRYPLEGVPITRAYPEYVLWRDSGGRNNRDWYLHPTWEADKVADPIEGLLPTRRWTLRGPDDRL